MRSSWKLPFTTKIFNKQIIKNKALDVYLGNRNIRNLTISKTLVNKSVYVHNGKLFFLVSITKKMVGHKLGEFVLNKVLGRDYHLASDKKRKKKKKKK
jgi:ribosomal protein S19